MDTGTSMFIRLSLLFAYIEVCLLMCMNEREGGRERKEREREKGEGGRERKERDGERERKGMEGLRERDKGEGKRERESEIKRHLSHLSKYYLYTSIHNICRAS